MAKARSSPRCRAFDDWPKIRAISGSCSALCSAIPERSIFSWAMSSASVPNGIMTPASIGTCSTIPMHAGLRRWVRDLNTAYRGQPALFTNSIVSRPGFGWVDCTDSERSVLTFLRRGSKADDVLLFACNFTPVVRTNYRVRECLSQPFGEKS